MSVTRIEEHKRIELNLNTCSYVANVHVAVHHIGNPKPDMWKKKKKWTQNDTISTHQNLSVWRSVTQETDQAVYILNSNRARVISICFSKRRKTDKNEIWVKSFFCVLFCLFQSIQVYVGHGWVAIVEEWMENRPLVPFDRFLFTDRSSYGFQLTK